MPAAVALTFYLYHLLPGSTRHTILLSPLLGFYRQDICRAYRMICMACGFAWAQLKGRHHLPTTATTTHYPLHHTGFRYGCAGVTPFLGRRTAHCTAMPAWVRLTS